MLFLLLFKDFSSFLSIYGTFQTLSNYSFIPSKKTPNQTLVCFMKHRREIAVLDVWETACDTALTHPLLISLLKQNQLYELFQLILLETLLWLLSTVIFTFKQAKQRAGT